MLEAFVVAAGAGFLLGLRYRPPALVAASGLAALLAPAIAYLMGSSFWHVVLSSVGAVVVLQCGYVGGLLVNFSATRAEPHTDDEPHHDVDTPDGCLAAKK
jgi:hypothetical protein